MNVLFKLLLNQFFLNLDIPEKKGIQPIFFLIIYLNYKTKYKQYYTLLYIFKLIIFIISLGIIISHISIPMTGSAVP